MKNCRNYIFFFLWTWLQQIEGFIMEDSSVEMDHFIDEYFNEVRRTLKLGLDQHTINKRSNPDIDLNKLTGVELLDGFRAMHTLPLRYPQDIVLFLRCSPDQKQWYSAALEAKTEESSSYLQGTELVLYKYQENKWRETHRVPALGGRSVAVDQIHDSMYLVVAQYLEDKTLGPTIWRLRNDSDTLQFVHMLDTQLATHAIMWTDTDTYVAVAVSENRTGSDRRYSTLSPVYRWRGDSFDMIDMLPTFNPRALVQFNIRSSMFVAVANFQNDLGETMVDSEIFRFDLTSGRFQLYQKLPTEAAIDIKTFCFQSSQITETFLIYASAFHTDERGAKDYNVPSIVYKLSDEEYFVPFQALQVSKVTSWLPIRHVKDGLESLSLLGASDEGIVSFQYDGWRFVPTGHYYDKSSFGSGAKSLNVFYLNDQTFISVANRNSDGYDENIFSPVYKKHTGVEDLQRVISQWVEEMTQELIAGERKIAELTRIAQEAPSVNDPVVQLGSHALLNNAEIYQLETMETEVGNTNADVQAYSKLLKLKSQFDLVKQTLANLPSRIDKTSIPTNTVYEDVEVDTLDIICPHNCHAENLEVINVNNENLSEFVANTVNVNDAIEIEGEISFKELALINPLRTDVINGHKMESLIDWTKDVVIDQELKVEGDVIVENSVTVSEAVDGVWLNIDRKEETSEVVVSHTSTIQTLNTSQLTLTDGKISQVDFRNFVLSTLKTQGNQVFSAFQDVGIVEADEITAADMYKAVSPTYKHPQKRSCEHENCSEDEDKGSFPTSEEGRASQQNIESINLLDDTIIITRNITIFGAIVVENGSLSAQDFIDVKHNVSTMKLLQFAIPLNQSTMEQHFTFKKEIKTPGLNVDTLNSLPVTSLVELGTEEKRLTGKKTFNGSVLVDGTLHLTNTINGINLTDTTGEKDLEQMDLENLTVNTILSEKLSFGPNNWRNRVMKDDGRVVFTTLNVDENSSAKSVMVRGRINNYHLEKLLNDTVFQGEKNVTIDGTKHFTGESKITNLIVNPSNSANFNFVTPENLWRKRLTQASNVEVDRLFYTGTLDGLEARMFGRWLLTEGDQSVAAAQTLTSLQVEDMVVPPGGFFNFLDFPEFLSKALLISDNATFDSAIFEGSLSSPEVLVGGNMNDLEVPADIVMRDPSVDQLIKGHKRVKGRMSVAGDLQTFGLVSGVNISSFCQILDSDSSSLKILGDAKFKQEPEILTSVNNIEWLDITNNAWFRDENVTITKKLFMDKVEFERLIVKNINNNNVEEELSKLVSLSKDQDINGTFYFSAVSAEKGLISEKVSVFGDVQGIKLTSFIKNVLLNNKNQRIESYLDFNKLVILNEFENTGFTNGLNISSDLMLVNVASNTVTSELTLEHLHTKVLNLPPGTLVAGVDIAVWNRTAVTKSRNDQVITGNVTFSGELDSSKGIRADRLVNGLAFDQKNLMLVNGSQEITAKKIFSSDSILTINELTVEGLLNHLNITEFYRQQVTASGDFQLAGPKQFTSPLRSDRVVLPEVYQGHNLTWLEYQLSAPLPWSSYDSQLANISHSHQLASCCLAGSAYYLKNMTRVNDLEGDVLFTLPLKSGNITALAAISRGDTENSSLSLSLLTWSEEQNKFSHMNGSENYHLRAVPSQVQSVTLPGGELAAYVTSHLPHNKTSSVLGLGNLIRMKGGFMTQIKVPWGAPGSTLLSFMDYKRRICFVMVADLCRVFCYTDGQKIVRLPTFSCLNVTKAALLTTDRGLYMLGVQSRLGGSLVLWRLSGRKFTLMRELPQFNPVSIAATTTTGPCVAVANLHQLGHSDPETVDIYRLDENTSELRLQQSLPVISPSLVMFSSLPTAESVLYVASHVPALPLQVYIYRGILGYQLHTEDSTLPNPSDLQAFNDHHQRHFLVIPSNHTASVLKAEFEGTR